MQLASPPPPPPPMLVGQPVPHGVPWMPQTLQHPMPAMPMMPFMPPMDHAMTPPPQVQVPEEVLDEQKKEKSAQYKLNKIVKAAKKEDHLSPEFQDLGSQGDEERRQGEYRRLACSSERTRSGKGSPLMEVERARMQLWSQWRIFLQQSVVKWKEYTAQFQSSETSFHTRMQDATAYLKRVQRRVDRAKKRADRLGMDKEDVLQISDDDMDEPDTRGGGRATTRRARSEDTRRTTPGGHQPIRSFRVSGKAGTKGKTTTHQRRRGSAWSQILQLTAFCQGRCFVTDVYGHQRPFDECSQWTHTILSEPTFLSPWRAAEQAFDLAVECGNWQTLRVDTFSLTPKKRSTKPGVRFDESVLVFQGKDDGAEFQPHLAVINDFYTRPVPRQCPSGAQMSSHTSGLSGTSSNVLQPSGQSPHSGLPSDLPSYVHHLQMKWRESGINLMPPERYRLRTWYIHHEHNPTWKIPRLVELQPDPLQWHHDILHQWRINFTVMQFSMSPSSSRMFVRYGKLKFMEILFSSRELMTVVEASPQSFRLAATNKAATHGQHHIPDTSVELRSFVEFLLTPFYSPMRVTFSMEECPFLSLLSPRIG